MASRIPPLLESYLGLPQEASLILLSGVLGSTTNWLVHRYLYSLLASSPSSSSSSASSPSLPTPRGAEDDGGAQHGVNVVLVSFMRDYAFWKDGAGRLGLDLDMSAKRGSFAFVDGLSGLFTSASPSHEARPLMANGPGRRVLSAATPQHLRTELEDAVAQVQAAGPGLQTVFIVDQSDLLLAASGDDMSSNELREVLLQVREKVHSTIVTLSADEPLIASQTTSLEKQHASLVLSLAHEAQLVMSLRMLDTGTARDVSGVLRITPGGESSDSSTPVEERELLYLVGGDGGVRVFERGQ
ncbi:Uu.00g113040.m01.CDS01 [Anthostomella pinea]|uniref:Uu.00g113040.m01.CDS01 n=1 Tax=Anthostomella pinea TaxID=933095 RepID=A0AAI8VGC5_9PEZI|nr:Uu.00g113040.m01.CDS01 [Anthostomella pinea]